MFQQEPGGGEGEKDRMEERITETFELKNTALRNRNETNDITTHHLSLSLSLCCRSSHYKNYNNRFLFSLADGGRIGYAD